MYGQAYTWIRTACGFRIFQNFWKSGLMLSIYVKNEVKFSWTVPLKISYTIICSVRAWIHIRIRIRIEIFSWIRIRIRIFSMRIRNTAAVPGSNPASTQPTADCQSPGRLPPGMALGWGLTSVRGNRGENSENELLIRQKHIRKKKVLKCKQVWTCTDGQKCEVYWVILVRFAIQFGTNTYSL